MRPTPGAWSAIAGSNVRRLRRMRDLKQSDLAAEANRFLICPRLTEGVIGFIERGQRSVSVDDLMALAMALDVSLSTLTTQGDLVDALANDAGPPKSLDLTALVDE